MTFDLASKLLTFGLPLLFGASLAIFALFRGFEVQMPEGPRFRTARFIGVCALLILLSLLAQIWPATQNLQKQLDLIALSERDAGKLRASIHTTQAMQSLAFPELFPEGKAACIRNAFATTVESQWKANHRLLSCQNDQRLCSEDTETLRSAALSALSGQPTLETSIALLDLFVQIDRQTFNAVRLQIPSLFGLSPFEGGPQLQPDPEAVKILSAAIANCREQAPPSWIEKEAPLIQRPAKYVWAEDFPKKQEATGALPDGSKITEIEDTLKSGHKTLSRTFNVLLFLLAGALLFVALMQNRIGHAMNTKANPLARALTALIAFAVVTTFSFALPSIVVAKIPLTLVPEKPFMGEEIAKLSLVQMNLQTELMLHMKDEDKRLANCLMRIAEYDAAQRFQSCDTKGAPCPAPEAPQGKEPLLVRLKSSDLSASDYVKQACDGVPTERLEEKKDLPEKEGIPLPSTK